MRLLGLFIVGVLLCAAQTAAAAVVIMPSDTSRDALLAWGAARPVLEQRDNPYTTGPVALGDGVFYSATNSAAMLGYSGVYNFTGHASWQGDVTPMTGVNAAEGAVSFVFATPVSAIIAQTNWAAAANTGAPVTISIFNDADVLLETLVVSDGKVDFEKAGSYLGFIRQNADIAKITFSNGFLGARDFFTRYGSNSLGGDQDGDGWNPGGGDNNGRPASSPPLDGGPGPDLPPIVQPGAVPEPATWALMLVGFGAMGGMLRGSHRRQAAAA